MRQTSILNDEMVNFQTGFTQTPLISFYTTTELTILKYLKKHYVIYLQHRFTNIYILYIILNVVLISVTIITGVIGYTLAL